MTLPEPYSAKDKTSFAYDSTIRRWPQILETMTEGLRKSSIDYDLDKQNEAKNIIDNIQCLIKEIITDKQIPFLIDDGGSSIDIYNDELRSEPRTWMTSSWLFAECYLYRRIRTVFALSRYFRDYDPFFAQKVDTFAASCAAVLKLAERMKEIVQEGKAARNELLFLELAQTCLWGNATDLSLLTDLKYEDVAKLQETSMERDNNILINDLHKVWNVIRDMNNERVDFILDNAGFELYVDMLFADWFIATGLAKQIIFHPRIIPWFVSDVTPRDFTWTIDYLRTQVPWLAERWSSYIENGSWRLSVPLDCPLGAKIGSGEFWTSPCPFSKMPKRRPDLLTDLQKSSLVIFKGDLNYRKLTSDLMWPRTTPFNTAIGDLYGKFNLLSLRTCKADVVVGLKDKEEDLLNSKDPRWAINGHYAVISFTEKQ